MEEGVETEGGGSSRAKGESGGTSLGSCDLSLRLHLPSTLSIKTPGFMATLALEREELLYN